MTPNSGNAAAPLRVLVAHNRYRSATPSGENVVVDAEVAMLRRAGVDVHLLAPSSDEIADYGPADKLGVALGPVRSRAGVHHFRQALAEHNPDVVHIHNVYPLLSPWIVREAHRSGVPVVMTVHNFRLDCVAGDYLRAGSVCTDCAGRALATPALIHGCYRGSRLQSIPMVAGRTLHRSTWASVDHFFALTKFHADFLQRLGIPDDRITIRPTSLADPGEPQPIGRDLLFVGRLGPEKGLDILLGAWERSSAKEQGRRLVIVGDGALKSSAEAGAARDATIVFRGPLAPTDAAAEIARAGVITIPSICFEGLPRVLVEALAAGRPVMASDIGGLATVVDDQIGWRVAPGDERAWASVLDSLGDTDVSARGGHARARFLERYDERATTSTLVNTYRAAARRLA